MTSNGSHWTRHCVTTSATALFAVSGSAIAFASRPYTFRHGDTLSSIARTYHVSVSDLELANHLDRAESIRDGKRLVIPDPPKRLALHATMRHTASAKGNRISLRLGPGADYRRINFVDDGSSLIVTAQKDGWFQVELDNGHMGWLRQDFVVHGPHAATVAHAAPKSSQHDSQHDRKVAHAAHHREIASAATREINHSSERGEGRHRRIGAVHTARAHVAEIAAHSHGHHGHPEGHHEVASTVHAAMLHHITRQRHVEIARTSPSRNDDIVRTAYAYRGTPYVYGGEGRGGFDCSGFTSYLYGRKGIALPHSARGQFGMGSHVDRSQLKPGDLVFFHTVTAGISHVGMYVGNGRFVHASSRRSGGVRVDNLDSGYYSSAYRGARRMR